MKYYKVTDGDLFAVSLVEDPAIESNFIALSKMQPIKLENEKRLLIGAALIPNKPIYRNYNGKEFYISFDEQTIEKLAQDFLANDYQHNITIDHLEDANDIVVVESWIKTSENDKSVDYGLNEPIGTWFIGVKVNNDEIWERVKQGQYKGFSIEAVVGLDEIINNKVLFSMDKELMDELVERVKAIVNDALGKKEEEPKEEVKEEVKEDEIKEEEEVVEASKEEPMVDEEKEALKAEKEALEAQLKELEEKMKAMDVEMEAVKAENVKLSKQPSTEPKRNEGKDGKNYSAAVKLMVK